MYLVLSKCKMDFKTKKEKTMTAYDFNKKYKEYLREPKAPGLNINIPELTEWLDNKFQEFIQQPGFSYSQIKAKFGMGRFYCEGLSNEQVIEVETKITEICKKY